MSDIIVRCIPDQRFLFAQKPYTVLRSGISAKGQDSAFAPMEGKKIIVDHKLIPNRANINANVLTQAWLSARAAARGM